MSFVVEDIDVVRRGAQNGFERKSRAVAVPARRILQRDNSGHQAIAFLRDRLDDAVLFWIVPKESAELRDASDQRVIAHDDVVPDGPHDLVFGHDLAGSFGEQNQNTHDFGLDVNLSVRPCCYVEVGSNDIQLQWSGRGWASAGSQGPAWRVRGLPAVKGGALGHKRARERPHEFHTGEPRVGCPAGVRRVR